NICRTGDAVFPHGLSCGVPGTGCGCGGKSVAAVPDREGSVRNRLRGRKPADMDRCAASRPGAADCRGASMNDIVDLTDLPSGSAEALANGTLADPFAVLGPHDGPIGHIVRTFLPGATQVEVVARAGGRSLGWL